MNNQQLPVRLTPKWGESMDSIVHRAAWANSISYRTMLDFMGKHRHPAKRVDIARKRRDFASALAAAIGTDVDRVAYGRDLLRSIARASRDHNSRLTSPHPHFCPQCIDETGGCRFATWFFVAAFPVCPQHRLRLVAHGHEEVLGWSKYPVIDARVDPRCCDWKGCGIDLAGLPASEGTHGEIRTTARSLARYEPHWRLTPRHPTYRHIVNAPWEAFNLDELRKQ